MKTIIKITIFFLALISFSSYRESGLDLYPETSLTEGTFYTNESQLIQVTNDVYRQLNRVYDAGGIVDLYGELHSDNTYIDFTGGATTFQEDILSYRIQTSNGNIQDAWETCYSAIFICNNMIDKLQKRGSRYKWTKNSGLQINAYRQAVLTLVAHSPVT